MNKTTYSITLAADEELYEKELEVKNISNYLLNRVTDLRRVEE